MELIYSIENIFSASRGGVLEHAGKYYIPTYQRGYKWGTEHINNLMQDLWDAYYSDEEQYFLQYLTLQEKEISGQGKVWEVIDGQQRLTTLSILFSVFGYLRLDAGSNGGDITENKIIYAIREDREDLLEKWGKKKLLEHIDKKWTDLIKDCNAPDRQDLYYMHNALHIMYDFLSNEERKDSNEERKDPMGNFYYYVNKKVFIILNVLENVSGEEVFENMNSNKKPLTDIELSKALLLTLKARSDEKKSFQEILEQRVIDGMHWDSISLWMNDEKIKHFFGSEKDDDGMEVLFKIIFNEDFKSNENIKYPIFSRIYNVIKDKEYTAENYFDEMKLQKGMLEKWYNDNEIYNFLGFAFFSKSIKDKFDTLKQLKDKNRTELLDVLKGIRKKRIEIPDETGGIENLQYDENKDKIRNILFAVNVFYDENNDKRLDFKNKNERFDFYRYSLQGWDIDHIFPLHPHRNKEEKQKLYYWDKKIFFEDLEIFDNLEDNIENKEKFPELKEKIKKLDDLKGHDAIELEEKESQLLSELIKRSKYSKKINGIGNLCLLSDSVNRSAVNKMFFGKRKLVIEKIIGGHFVPKATFAVFSKMICTDFDPTLESWTLGDMEKYLKEIELRYKNLLGEDA